MTTRIFCAVAALAAAVVSADTASNIYTVVVNDGTFAAPVLIDNQQVEIYDAEAGMTTTEDFTNVTFKGVHYEIIVDVKGFKWMIQTTDFHAPGDEIGIKLNPDDIHIMKKSEYSGKFGDYSSYSEEYDKLDDATILNDDSDAEVID